MDDRIEAARRALREKDKQQREAEAINRGIARVFVPRRGVPPGWKWATMYCPQGPIQQLIYMN